YLAIIERSRSRARNLDFLMPLSCDQDDVALSRLSNGQPYCGCAIRLSLVGRARALQSDNGIVDDGKRVFAARVVGREHNKVATPSRCFAHQRTLGSVAIAAAPKDRDHAAAVWFGKFASEYCEISQGVVSVSVINRNREWLSTIHPLEAPGDASKGAHACGDIFALTTSGMSRGRSSKNVVGVYAANQRRADRDRFVRGD